MIINRLKRVEGQVRGLQRMVSEERDCESIITQLAAVRSAIDSAGGLILNNYMTLCFNKSQEQPPPSEGESLKSLARVIAIWGRVKMSEGK
ncbi:MAG: metal-sensitive transcriptional regulator [Dehalococcoidales bacterium]|nr:metal-sensitive transcriptional regulator [Dehalococcoidales bacterium]